MPNCFLCGTKIPPKARHIRRKVKTGERILNRYPSRRISAVNAIYGMRVVCGTCAKSMDSFRFSGELWKGVGILALLFVVFVLLVIDQ